MVKVAATVVNYRTPELATKAVNGLLAQLRLLGPHHLYLVDNASGDDSLEHFRRAGERDGWKSSVTASGSNRARCAPQVRRCLSTKRATSLSVRVRKRTRTVMRCESE